MIPVKAQVTQTDLDNLWRMRDLHVGQLDQHDLDCFYRCMREGYAEKVYNTAAGAMLGLASVGLTGKSLVEVSGVLCREEPKT